MVPKQFEKTEYFLKKTDALKYLRKAHKLSPHDETIKQHLREAEGPDDDEDSEQE